MLLRPSQCTASSLDEFVPTETSGAKHARTCCCTSMCGETSTTSRTRENRYGLNLRQESDAEPAFWKGCWCRNSKREESKCCRARETVSDSSTLVKKSIGRTHQIDMTKPEHQEGEEKKHTIGDKANVDTVDHGTPTDCRACPGTDLGQREGQAFA